MSNDRSSRSRSPHSRSRSRTPSDMAPRSSRGTRSKSRSRSRSRSVSGDTYDIYANDHKASRSPSRSRSRSRTRSRTRSRSPVHKKKRSRTRSPSRSRNRSRSRTPESAANEHLRSAWTAIKNEPNDFDAWTALLAKVESLNEMKPAREAFERFLIRYPYCYGYWRKYAEMERRNSNYEKALEVWERSVSAIPLCIDLWIPFLGFFKELAIHADGGVTKIRELMERSLLSAGMEYNSDRLWNEVINFEMEQSCPRRAMEIFERLLRIPTAFHVQQFERFQQLVNSHEPDVILSDDEYYEIFTKTRKNVDVGVDQMIIEERLPLDGAAQGAPGEEQVIVKKRHVPEVLAYMREEILARRRVVHLDTAGQVMKRAPFEEKIKRPYFHVKPLDSSEFENWRQYIDMEIDTGTEPRVVVLFERCLIATALYDEFWIKYARWRHRKLRDEDGARAVFRRACDTHCTKRPLVFIAHSAFEESCGEVDVAERILVDFDRRVPGLAIVQQRLRGLERRRIVADAKRKGEDPDYTDVIAKYEKMIRTEGMNTGLISYYSIKLAQFHSRIRNEPSTAVKIIKEALRSDPANYNLMLQLVDISMQIRPMDEKLVIEAFDHVLQSKSISSTEKLEISQRKLEFLEEYGSDIRLMQDHLDVHHDLVHKSDVRLAKKRLQLIEKSLTERVRRTQEVKRPRYSLVTSGRGRPMPPQRDRGDTRDKRERGDREDRGDRRESRDRERGGDRHSSRHGSSRRH